MFFCDEEEVEAVSRVLRSKKLFRYQGEGVPTESSLFEEEFSKYLGQKHSLLLSSGSNALVSALKCLDIKQGDEILVPAYTFFATISAVLDYGAVPIIVEINEFLTMDLGRAENLVNRKTKAIIAVHMDGVPCDMNQILGFAKKFNLLVIEDSAQGLGASFHNKKLGTFGNAGCFSFNADKIISCGEGGALCVNNDHQYQKALMFHDSSNQFGATLKNRYTIEPFAGRSMRVSEIQAAMIRVQLRRLDKIVEALRVRKKILEEKLVTTGNVLIASADRFGESATTVRIELNDPIDAQKTMIKLQTTGLRSIVASMRPGHNVWKWLHLLPPNLNLSKENFLHTIELLSKTVLINISLEEDLESWERKTNFIQKF